MVERPKRALALTALLLACVVVLLVATALAMGMRHGGMMGGGGHGGMMGPPPSLGENPVTRSPAVLERGQALYVTHCAVCHGPQGRGDGPAAAGLNPRPHDLLGHSRDWSDGQLAAQISNGRGAMPAFAAVIKGDDLWSLVHAVRRLQGR